MKTLKLTHPNQHKKQGFTIIEVVLVLAIAGLIFLMVFIALPALQRSQRDAQRKNDMTRLSDGIDRWIVNNARGNRDYAGRLRLPEGPTYKMGFSLSSNILNGYLKADQGEFVDPDGSEYKTMMMGYWSSETSFYEPEEFNHVIYISGGPKCNGENLAAKTNGDPRMGYVIQYKLEGGGKVCIDKSNSSIYIPRFE